MLTTSLQTLPRRSSHTFAAAAICLAAAVTLTGCGIGANGTASAGSTAGALPKAHLHGIVHGGQQPVSGSTIQLYDIPIGNPSNGAYTLLSPAPTTGPDGSFNITGQYQCLGQGDLTYIVSTGGNPGLGAGTNNAAISLVAVTGACNTANPDANGDGGFYYTLDPNLNVNLNEVTTVAAAYALAPFTSSFYYGEIASASPTAIATAFTNATMLANIGTGVAPGPGLPAAVTYDPSTGFPNVINTVADVIASCVNSNGTGTACSQLFSSFTAYGAYPSDTFGAAVAMATFPAANVLALYDLKSPQPPFIPFLPKPPNDFTVALKYTGLNLSSPQGLAFDSLSNLWIANATGSFITEVYSGADGLNTAGAFNQYTGGGLLGPQAIAVDLSNNIWIANTAGSSVVELDDDGNVLSGTGFTGGGINAPVSIAMDANGNAWVANFNGNTITQLLSDGTPSGFSPIAQGLSAGVQVPVSLPTFVAVDSMNDVWVSNAGLNATYGLTTGMLRFDQNGNPQSCSTQNLAGPMGIAFDRSGKAWVAANGISAVQPFTSACATNGDPITGGGLSSPVALAVDGGGNIWTANRTGEISEQAATTGTPTSPSIGYGTLNQPNGIAIDACGSVWTANAGDNSLTEFIGLAVPPAATPVIASFSVAGRGRINR
jgi:sugar lactone lactonase YvrE